MYRQLLLGIDMTGHYLGSPPTQVRRSTDTRFDTNDLKQSCLLINTADYCQTTALEVLFHVDIDIT